MTSVAACAEHLAAGGATVALSDLASRTDALEATAARCAEAGASKVLRVPFDVTDEADINKALDGVGPIHQLANVAGYQGAFKPVGEYPIDDCARVMAINVTGMLAVTQAVVRRMTSEGIAGTIAGLASMAGVGGAANMPAYAASKAAVIGLTKAASKDLAPLGIRINCVSPAFIGPGDMWDRQVHLQADTPSQYYSDDTATVEAEMIGAVPLRRVGSVEEVASVVTWLLSDASSYVTGENILVTGGIL